MKKVLLIVAMAMISTGAFAQSINVKAGMNVSSHIGDDDAKAIIGFKAGAGVEFSITDMFSIEPSLMFATKGMKYEATILSSTVTAKVTQMYLELPILAKARINIGDNMNFTIGLGPYLAYGVGGKWKTVGDTPSGGWDREGAKAFGDNGYRPFDAGVALAAGFEFGRIIVGLDTELGLVKLHENISNKNMSFSVGVGYRF